MVIFGSYTKDIVTVQKRKELEMKKKKAPGFGLMGGLEKKCAGS